MASMASHLKEKDSEDSIVKLPPTGPTLSCWFHTICSSHFCFLNLTFFLLQIIWHYLLIFLHKMCHYKFFFSRQIMNFSWGFGGSFLQANIAWLISIEGMITGGKEYSGYISFGIIQCGSNSDWPALEHGYFLKLENRCKILYIVVYYK